MKTNEDLQKSVQDAIKWEPLLHAAEIGVTVSDGVVTLTGIVDSYAKKLEAENAAKNVAGVKVVIEKITLNFGDVTQTTDGDIASAITRAIKWNWRIPNDKIKVKVEDGWVTLEGEVNWGFQKETTKNALVDLIGVKGVFNNITIKSEHESTIKKEDIERAIARSWLIYSKRIEVQVDEHKVTLIGSVNSIFEKEEAERIAWKAPGIWELHNNLRVEYSNIFV